MALFPAFYAGNISYYTALLRANEVVFDAHEHFHKQTYRNRTEILGPNGLQKLVIPTAKTGQRRPMGEVRISYAEAWQKNHWKSMEAAYRRSPYFEYYEDRFRPFYTGRIELLLEFNIGVHQRILELLQVDKPYTCTTHYVEPRADGADFREGFEQPPHLNPYLQVFTDRHPFVANLSILDVLFNLGPATRQLLAGTAHG